MEQNVRFSVASLISDHAVLQRDEVIPVRGRGRAGARVRAELEPEWVVKADGVIQPKSGWGVVNPAGTWLVELPPFAAGGPYCLRVESEREELEFHDLYFGPAGSGRRPRRNILRYFLPLAFSLRRSCMSVTVSRSA